MAGSHPRQSLDALFAQLDYERGQGVIIVEGDLDRSCVAFMVREGGWRNSAVFQASDFEVPPVLFDGDDSPGERERLLRIALECEKELGSNLPNLAVLVDLDRDAFRSTPRSYGPYGFATDHSCFEGYLATPDTIERAVSLFLGAGDVDSQQLLDTALSIAHEVYLVRSAQHRLKLKCRVESCGSDVDPASLSFDRDSFVRRLLLAGGKLHMVADLEAEVERLRSSTFLSPVEPFNGHDLLDVLCLMLRPRIPPGARTMLSVRSLGRVLSSNTDWASVAAMPSIDSLLSRVSSLG